MGQGSDLRLRDWQRSYVQFSGCARNVAAVRPRELAAVAPAQRRGTIRRGKGLERETPSLRAASRWPPLTGNRVQFRWPFASPTLGPGVLFGASRISRPNPTSASRRSDQKFGCGGLDGAFCVLLCLVRVLINS